MQHRCWLRIAAVNTSVLPGIVNARQPWIAQQVHPELFGYDFTAELRDYYRRFYGYELSDDEVHLILNPVF